MKVGVINYSGNVGKSTLARHFLAPRMNTNVIAVETINSDGTDDEAIKGKQFGELIEALGVLNAAVIDVGSSNVEEFVAQMKTYRGSHEDFDFFVVPTVPKTKQLRDTISTIEALAEIGVPAKKIRLVFNMVEHGDNPAQIFSSLLDYHSKEKTFTIKEEAVIHANDIFGKIQGGEESIMQILNEDIDVLKSQLKETTSSDERLRISRRISIKRLATGVTEELDMVFKALFVK